MTQSETRAERRQANERVKTGKLREAFARAETEAQELARLRAQHPRYSGLYFKRELATNNESENA